MQGLMETCGAGEQTEISWRREESWMGDGWTRLRGRAYIAVFLLEWLSLVGKHASTSLGAAATVSVQRRRGRRVVMGAHGVSLLPTGWNEVLKGPVRNTDIFVIWRALLVVMEEPAE